MVQVSDLEFFANQAQARHLRHLKNLRNIQVLLRHESTKTTEIYTHVINVSNQKNCKPLDMMIQNGKFKTLKQTITKQNLIVNKTDISTIHIGKVGIYK